MTDEDVRSYFSDYKHKVTKDIKQYLENRFDDCDDYKEAKYRIMHHMTKIPVCKLCGKPVKFRKLKYNIYCSTKCRALDTSPFKNPETHKKVKEIILERYNVDNVFRLESIKEKSRKTKIKRYGDPYYYDKEKLKKTCLERYGSSSPLGNKEIWERTRTNTIKHYGCAYNKDKLNDTLMKKYGVRWFTQSEKLKKSTNTDETKHKQYETKKQNHTFNSSSTEKKTYDMLKSRFPDVIDKYRTDKYPFNCDFYIPSHDLYIECQYHWTHGKHPYDKDNEEDRKLVELWESKNTKFYDNAIKTWTVRDVKKRTIAHVNNLNYIEFFSFDEFLEWYENFE